MGETEDGDNDVVHDDENDDDDDCNRDSIVVHILDGSTETEDGDNDVVHDDDCDGDSIVVDDDILDGSTADVEAVCVRETSMVQYLRRTAAYAKHDLLVL